MIIFSITKSEFLNTLPDEDEKFLKPFIFLLIIVET